MLVCVCGKHPVACDGECSGAVAQRMVCEERGWHMTPNSMGRAVSADHCPLPGGDECLVCGDKPQR